MRDILFQGFPLTFVHTGSLCISVGPFIGDQNEAVSQYPFMHLA